jgi:hypothetical protein
LALHAPIRGCRPMDLGICSDVPAKDGEILLERAELGATIPGLAGVETRLGNSPCNLRVDDSNTFSAESQDGSYRRPTGICVRGTLGNFDCFAKVSQIRKRLLPAGRSLHYAAIAVRVSPYRHCL